MLIAGEIVSVTSIYLVCPKRRNLPRINIEICRRCPKRGSCPALKQYSQPSLFEFENEKHERN